MASKKKVNPIPEGYHTVTPGLAVRNAAQAIEDYKKAFGAKEKKRMHGPDGKTIIHADIKMGDSHHAWRRDAPDGSPLPTVA